jgi:hypothetical protein
MAYSLSSFRSNASPPLFEQISSSVSIWHPTLPAGYASPQHDRVSLPTSFASPKNGNGMKSKRRRKTTLRRLNRAQVWAHTCMYTLGQAHQGEALKAWKWETPVMWRSLLHIHVVGGSCRPSAPSQRFLEVPLDGAAEPLQDVRRAKDERARIVVPDAVHLHE